MKWKLCHVASVSLFKNFHEFLGVLSRHSCRPIQALSHKLKWFIIFKWYCTWLLMLWTKSTCMYLFFFCYVATFSSLIKSLYSWTIFSYFESSHGKTAELCISGFIQQFLVIYCKIKTEQLDVRKAATLQADCHVHATVAILRVRGLGINTTADSIHHVVHNNIMELSTLAIS